MLGYSRDELMTLTFADITHPDDVAENVDALRRMLVGTEDTYVVEKRYLRKGGDAVWVDLHVSLVRDGEGRPLYSCDVLEDITDKKRAEAALAASEAKFSTAFRTSPDAVNINRLSDGMYMDTNEGFARLTGYTPQDVAGKTSYDISIWDDTTERDRLVAGLMADGYVDNLEARFRRKDGTVTTALMSARVIDIEGEPCILSVTRDISERKAAEAELRRRERQLEGLLQERERNLELLGDSLSSLIEVVGQVVEMRDPYTAGHQRRVAELGVRIMQELGATASQTEEVRLAALIHDVGKVSVPAEVLTKPSKLSPVELELMKGHSEAGYRIIASADMEGQTAELIYQHHERCDGSGYPRGLTGDQLLPEAKVLMVADVVEAMVSHRPYRAALGLDAALAEIERGAGTLYDPAVCSACARIFRDGTFSFPAN
jgi:PAS domain S-box-containing protein